LPDGVLAGLQISPMALPDLAVELASLAYIRRVPNGQLQILIDHLDASTELREEVDQSFGGRIYRSFGNEVAISLDTFFLDDSERQYLASRPLHWVTVTPIGE